MRPQRIEPGPGQESVWDYPRPPRIEPSKRRAKVMLAGLVIADSGNALRVLETSGPPTIYIPIEDIDMERLEPVDHSSYCEWKGAAHYFDVVVVETRAGKAAWHYPDPKEGFATLEGYVAFYPGRVDACYLGDELVTPQPGGFYGGWITRDIVGPFKGEPGTSGW